MKKALVLAAILLGGCPGDPSKQQTAINWGATVLPSDPVPEECTNDPPKRPRMQDKAANAKDSARAYQALDQWADRVAKPYERCRTWAKGQR